jgi:Flp pilus assembly protein TadD
LDDFVNNTFRTLVFALVALASVLVGAKAESSADIQDKLHALLTSLQSATGNFLAGEEAMDAFDTVSASDYLASASRQEPDNALLVLRTFYAQAANGEIETAAKTGRRFNELTTGDETSKLIIGTVALKQRQYNEAINALRDIDAHSVIGITAAVVRAWALVGDNRYDEAETALDELADGSIDGFLIYHRALMADVADRHDAAISYAETAYKAEPYDVRYIEAYARMLANRSRFVEAQRLIRVYREQGLDDPSVLALEADLKAGRRPGKLAANAQTGAAEVYHIIGSALVRDGTADIAAIYLRTALYLAPGFDLAAMELAGLYDNNEQYDTANAIYRSLKPGSPYKRKAEVREIQNTAAAGDRDKAIQLLQANIDDNPDNLDAIVALGDMLRASERYTEASEAYSLVIGLVGGGRPQDWRYYYLRGMCYERDKEWVLAEKDFETALELSPHNPQVLNYLGYSWIDQGMHLDKALEMIKTALEWNPSDGYFVDSLGWAYYRLGRYEEAVETLEQAVQLRPSDSAINDHLGDAYWQAGRKLEARFQWTIAADLEPESDIGMLARDKLSKGLEAVDSAVTDG